MKKKYLVVVAIITLVSLFSVNISAMCPCLLENSDNNTDFEEKVISEQEIVEMFSVEDATNALDDYKVGVYADADYTAESNELIDMLNENGISSKLLSETDVVDEAVIDIKNLNCIILLNKAETQGVGKDLFIQYLKDGGDLVVGGADLFQTFNNGKMKLPIYEGYLYEPYNISGTKKISATSGQGLFKSNKKISGNFSGTSAVGFLFPDSSKYIPVLDANNGVGVKLGNAAGVLTHFDGEYKDGNWLIYGIAEQSFYGLEYFREVTAEILKIFKSGLLAEKYSKEKIVAANKEALSKFEITEAKPEGSVTLDKETGKIIGPDGKELFIIGANTFGDAEYLLGMGKESDGTFSIEKIENIFRIASENGVNCLRFWQLPTTGKRVDVIKNAARKYGVYIYVHTGIIPDREQDIINLENYAKAYGDEPMVIGYDLINEPQIHHIMSRFDGEENPLIKADIYSACEEYMTTTWKESYNWLDDDTNNAYAGWVDYFSPELKKQIITADVMMRKELFDGSESHTLSGISFKNEFNEAQQITYNAINETIEKWISSRREIIHKYDSDALITVGYFNRLALFPANSELDFQNLHAYSFANTKEDIEDGLSAFDLLNETFPTSATMYGEFCYSGGQILKDGPHMGELADFDVANAGEFLHWLYAYSKGYSGAVIWALQEWNPCNYRYNNTQYGEWEPNEGLRRERQGLLYYAGDLDNKYRPKPVALALKFFSSYMDNHKPGEGALTITNADNQAEIGYSYITETSEYAADTDYDSGRMKFTSDRTPIVMADWSNGEINIMSTEDVTVEIKPESFINLLTIDKAIVSGICNFSEKNGDSITISLVAGKPVNISNFKEVFICK